MSIHKHLISIGHKELCETLLKDEALMANESAKKGVEEMQTLLKFLDIFEVKNVCKYDPVVANTKPLGFVRLEFG